MQTAEVELRKKKTLSLFAGGALTRETRVEMVDSDNSPEEELATPEEEEEEDAEPSSLWQVLYANISSAKFEELLQVIREMHRIMVFQSDAVRKREVQKYLQGLHTAKRAAQRGVTLTAKAADRASDQGAFSESLKLNKRQAVAMTPGEQKIQDLKAMVDGMSRQFKQQKESLTKIKTAIRYRPPLTEAPPVSDDPAEERYLSNLARVQSKIAFLWKGGSKIHSNDFQINEDSAEHNATEASRRHRLNQDMRVLGVQSALTSPKATEGLLSFKSRARPQSKETATLETSSHLLSEQRHFLTLKQHQVLAGQLLSYALDKLI